MQSGVTEAITPCRRAYEERWLESNIVGAVGTLLSSVNADHIYPASAKFHW